MSAKTWTEYAAIEPGYEHEAVWTRSREDARREARWNRESGLASFVIKRTVTVSEWERAR